MGRRRPARADQRSGSGLRRRFTHLRQRASPSAAERVRRALARDLPEARRAEGVLRPRCLHAAGKAHHRAPRARQEAGEGRAALSCGGQARTRRAVLLPAPGGVIRSEGARAGARATPRSGRLHGLRELRHGLPRASEEYPRLQLSRDRGERGRDRPHRVRGPGDRPADGRLLGGARARSSASEDTLLHESLRLRLRRLAALDAPAGAHTARR